MTARLFFILGLVSAILGIISDTVNKPVGMESITWLLVSIGLFLAAIPCCPGWAIAVYLKNKKGKKD